MLLLRVGKKVLSKFKDLIKEEHEELKGEEALRKCSSKYPLLISRFKKIMLQVKNEYPQYIWGVIVGADLARELGIKGISVIEFGVSGGKGLVTLEKIAKEVEKIYELNIDVYGFDLGTGLPKPKDYRDLPFHWGAGYFPMEKEKLLKRLQKGKLILGPIKDTILGFIESAPKPVAFISFDLDLYSSTMDAFKILETDEKLLLPRIHCYFDDITGFSFGDFNGERLAMTEFNSSHELRKISKIYELRSYLKAGLWAEKAYLFHLFNHSLYNKSDGMIQNKERPL